MSEKRTPFEERCDEIAKELDMFTDLDKEFMFWYLIPDMIQKFRKDMDCAKASIDAGLKEHDIHKAMLANVSLIGLGKWCSTLDEIREAETLSIF